MLQKKNIAIIGPGVMGKTIALSLIQTGNLPPEQILMAGPNQDRLNQLQAELGVRTTLSNAAAARAADVVILAVKPQRLDQAASALKGALEPGKLVISILAGAPLSALEQKLGTRCLVRAMPNTPARIGMGITVWTKTAEVDEAQHEIAAQIMRTLGEEVFVADEAYLDMATALSGTGPAYVFLFMEAMIDAGVHMGFPRRIAEQLVVQTLRGSTEFYLQSRGHPAQLRDDVTSPGGTSAEALYYLEKAGFRTAISRAIWAAYQRGIELGKGISKQGLES
ncbi:MAG TPA: pyrroline-5-carboxylate reductase [Anaerolineaceae bacterium]|jgi:pyrroline-5-carboxylate reductase|nr:pyrroline-5-carboxylate reductase [Anaerolineaceae bacterium]